MNKLKYIVFSAAFILSVQSYGSVWESQNQWTPERETQFSNWVKTDWDDEIFMREGSILKGIETDCADASYTMRMYFSFLNKLPFKIYNPAGTSKYITNDSKDFDNISDSKARFLAFVRFVNDLTDTGSLGHDTYPIAINKSTMRSGIVYVSPNDHTYQIKKINENGIPTIYSSTVPKEVRYLNIVESFPFYMPKDLINHRDGYRAFKQPQDYEVSESQIAGYSLEQYEMSKAMGEDILGFGDLLAKKLSSRAESLGEQIDRGALNLCTAVQNRAITISWTILRVSKNNYACFNSSQYDLESTPSRDKRIKMIYLHLQDLARDPHFFDATSRFQMSIRVLFDGKPNPELGILSWCPISKYGNISEEISLKTVWQSIQANKFVSDPNASTKARWGLEDYAPRCPTY